MFKKIMFAVACAAVLGLASACSSVQIGQDLNDVKLTTNPNYESEAHINVEIWGIYILGFPIFIGSSRANGECRMFEDTVNVPHAIRLLTGNAQAKLNCTTLTDIQTTRSSVWLTPTLFFFYKDVQASATALK